MLHTILVPLDGTPLAETALEPATLLAKRFDAEVLLVHAITSDDMREFAPPETGKGSTLDSQTYLEAVARHLREEGVLARISLLPMDAAEGIVDEASFSGVDLIVMTPHTRRGLAALLHASVTWQVLQQGAAPILACKASKQEDAAASVKSMPRFLTDPHAPIVVPLDGSPFAESALPLAEELARMFGNSLVLVSAYEQPVPTFPVGTGIGPIEMGGESLLVAQATRQAEEATRAYLASKQSELANAGMQAQTEVGMGPAAAFIEEMAKQHQAGLIVMASRGRGWLGRLVLGSVAEKVLRDVDMPVLLTRREPPDQAVPPGDQPAASETRASPQ
jgi:nucleotide-binding universal stress UspA family protein